VIFDDNFSRDGLPADKFWLAHGGEWSAYILMVLGRKVLGEVKLALLDKILDPIKMHVNGFGV
jgi:hypothetical protein